MKLPIILRADDGITWWPDAVALQHSIESPDIEAGIYSAWDSQGQILEVAPLWPVFRRRFFGMESVDVSPGKLIETGIYNPEDLKMAILDHLSETPSPAPDNFLDLPAAVNLLCQNQQAR